MDIESLLAPLGGIKKYVGKGDKVLLKVNLLAPKEPSKAITTHPAVVAAVANAVLDAGGEPYVGDSPSGLFNRSSLKRAYRKSGLYDLVRRMDLELNYDISSKRVLVPCGKKLKKVSISNYILKADKIIALPKIKTHDLMVMTLATKIMFGAVPGLTKAKYHSMFPRKRLFADMLLDVLSTATPDLFIMDGVWGMEGNGPRSGKPVKLGVMLASENALAMDLAVCEMLGIEPLVIPTLKRARIRGMWPKNIKYPLLSPSDVKIKGFELPSTARKKTKLRPRPNDRCIGCGKCEEICPRGAIKVAEGKAEVTYSRCIGCYCCREVCPEDAIDLVAVK